MSDVLPLPPPQSVIERPLWQTLLGRRSVRVFAPRPVEWPQIGALLWAGQGVSEPKRKFRTAPSAGALYPLELDVATPGGLFRYRVDRHAVELRMAMDLRPHLAVCALGQPSVAEAACVVAISADPSRTLAKYGERGMRYVHLEAGHAAENILLTACSLGLVGVPVGAFRDDYVAATLHLRDHEVPLYLVPIGWPR